MVGFLLVLVFFIDVKENREQKNLPVLDEA